MIRFNPNSQVQNKFQNYFLLEVDQDFLDNLAIPSNQGLNEQKVTSLQIKKDSESGKAILISKEKVYRMQQEIISQTLLVGEPDQSNINVSLMTQNYLSLVEETRFKDRIQKQIETIGGEDFLSGRLLTLSDLESSLPLNRKSKFPIF